MRHCAFGRCNLWGFLFPLAPKSLSAPRSCGEPPRITPGQMCKVNRRWVLATPSETCEHSPDVTWCRGAAPMPTNVRACGILKKWSMNSPLVTWVYLLVPTKHLCLIQALSQPAYPKAIDQFWLQNMRTRPLSRSSPSPVRRREHLRRALILMRWRSVIVSKPLHTVILHTYNSNSVIVDVCNLMKLLFKLSVLPCGPVSDAVRSRGTAGKVMLLTAHHPGARQFYLRCW